MSASPLTGSPLPGSSPSEPASAAADGAVARLVDRWLPTPDFRGAITAGEVVVGALATVIAVVALCSLATAHLGILTLGSVATASVVLLAVVGVLAYASPYRPRLVLDVPGLVLLLATVAVAAWFYLPGFPYAAGDKDPGGYVQHAIAMTRTHSYELIDPALRDGLPVQVQSPGARFPAVWIRNEATGRIVPQFYHLWPALLATSWNVHGWSGLVATTPLVAIVAAALCVCVARRLFAGTSAAGRLASFGAAGLTGLLLATNMIQVWQAKYPTSEILAQLLYALSVLALVIALQTRWYFAAGLAGAATTIGYLNRGDGVLLVIAMVGLGCALWVLRRFDGRAVWCAVGLGVLLPYGAWQAYGAAGAYTKSVGITPRTLLLPLVAGVVLALILRPALRRLVPHIERWLAERRYQRILGYAFVAATVALFVLGLARRFIFGEAVGIRNGVPIRTLDELTVYRLAWFITWPGWLLLLVGIAVLVLRRWRPEAWLIVLPLVGLLGLYGWRARNSSFLMWWSRRFVPTVWVGLMIAVAVAVAWLVSRWLDNRLQPPHRGLYRTAGVLAVAGALVMVGTGVQQSRPLQAHAEWRGTFEVEQQIADLAGDQTGVFLWQRATYCCAAPVALFAAPIWMIFDQVSVLLPAQEAIPSYVESYLTHFAGQPVFLVYDQGATPPPIPNATVTVAERFTGTFPHWAESSTSRPSGPVAVPYDFTVYRVIATSS